MQGFHCIASVIERLAGLVGGQHVERYVFLVE